MRNPKNFKYIINFIRINQIKQQIQKHLSLTQTYKSKQTNTNTFNLSNKHQTNPLTTNNQKDSKFKKRKSLTSTTLSQKLSPFSAREQPERLVALDCYSDIEYTIQFAVRHSQTTNIKYCLKNLLAVKRMGFNYLRKIDTFGVPIDLCFEKKKMHKTPWGGFWTLIIFLFSLAVFIILGQEIVFRQKPSVIAVEQLERGAEASNINSSSQNSDWSNSNRATYGSSGLIIAFAAFDEDLNLIQNWSSSFSISGQIINQRAFSVVGSVQLSEFKQCSNYDDMQTADNQKLFSEFDLSELVCMQSNDTLDSYLTGQMGSEVYNHLKISISYKSSGDSQMKQKLKYVGLFFTDQMMDVQNYSDPLTKYRKNIIQKVNSDSKYEIVITNQYAQIMTDEGYMWSEYGHQNFFSFKEHRVNVEQTSDNTLLVLQTEIDPKLLVYNVSNIYVQL